ncbi:hypothetical protein Dip510_000804 [Elusimicrobium posterum]|uniref:hypothetical protein n=1 Tax=Elusimicrobium posterum TaxID=3116653 RepID=UPI003C7638DB
MPKKVLAYLITAGLMFMQLPSELYAQKAIQAVTYYPTPYGAYMNVDADTVVVKDTLEVNTLNDVTKLNVSGTLTGNINRLEADNAVVKNLGGNAASPTIKATKRVHVSNESEVTGIVADSANVANTFYLDGLAFPYAKAIDPKISNMNWKQITYYTDKTNKKTATRTFLVLEDVSGPCTVERLRRADLDIAITTKDEFTLPDLAKYLAKDTCNQNFDKKFTCGDDDKQPESCIDYTLGTSMLGKYHQPTIITTTGMEMSAFTKPAKYNSSTYGFSDVDTRNNGGGYAYYGPEIIVIPSAGDSSNFETASVNVATKYDCNNLCYLYSDAQRESKGLETEREYFESVGEDIYSYEYEDHCVYDPGSKLTYTFKIMILGQGYGSGTINGHYLCTDYNECRTVTFEYKCASPQVNEAYYDDYTYLYHANEVKCCDEEADSCPAQTETVIASGITGYVTEVDPYANGVPAGATFCDPKEMADFWGHDGHDVALPYSRLNGSQYKCAAGEKSSCYDMWAMGTVFPTLKHTRYTSPTIGYKCTSSTGGYQLTNDYPLTKCSYNDSYVDSSCQTNPSFGNYGYSDCIDTYEIKEICKVRVPGTTGSATIKRCEGKNEYSIARIDCCGGAE